MPHAKFINPLSWEGWQTSGYPFSKSEIKGFYLNAASYKRDAKLKYSIIIGIHGFGWAVESASNVMKSCNGFTRSQEGTIDIPSRIPNYPGKLICAGVYVELVLTIGTISFGAESYCVAAIGIVAGRNPA